MELQTSASERARPMDEHSSVSPTSLPPDRLFRATAIFSFLLELILASHDLAGFPGPDRYFAYQWTVSYANGFTRRGLIGAVLRALHINNGNYAFIAVFSWLITIALFVFALRALCRVLAPLPLTTRRVLLLSMLVSPLITGTLIATTGDPMQLILLAFFVLDAVLLKPSTRSFIVLVCFAAFGAFSMLVHEASLFLILPALFIPAVMSRSRLRIFAVLGYLLAAIPALVLIYHATENHSSAAAARMYLGHTTMVASAPPRLETFSSLLQEENGKHFHNGLKGYVLTVRDLIGALTLPVFFAAVVARLLSSTVTDPKTRSQGRVLASYGLTVLLSMPLWIIAHDWGRFACYLFILTLSGLALAPTAFPQHAPAEQNTPIWYAVLLLLAGVTSSRALPQYLVKGLGEDNPTLLGALLLCAVGWYLLQRNRETLLQPMAHP